MLLQRASLGSCNLVRAEDDKGDYLISAEASVAFALYDSRRMVFG